MSRRSVSPAFARKSAGGERAATIAASRSEHFVHERPTACTNCVSIADVKEEGRPLRQGGNYCAASIQRDPIRDFSQLTRLRATGTA